MTGCGQLVNPFHKPSASLQKMGSLWLICYTALPALSIVKGGKLKVVNSESSRAYLSDQWDNNFEIWFLECSNIFCTLFLFPKSLIHESKSLCRYAERPRDWFSNLASAQPFPFLAQFPKMAIIICLYFYLVLRLHEADLKWQRDGKRTKKQGKGTRSSSDKHGRIYRLAVPVLK